MALEGYAVLDMNSRDPRLYNIYLTTLMAVIGVSLISPAFPQIRDVLGLSSSEVGLLVTVFTVPGIFFSPLAGWSADKWGRKPVLLVALCAFGITGGGISMLRSFDAILVCRFMQGCAAASLSTVSLALIADYYHGTDQETVMGYNGTVLSIGTASYPSLGGLLAGISWYAPFYVFFLALPLGIYVYLTLPEPPSHGTKRREGRSWALLANPGTLALMGIAIATFILLYGSYLTFFPQFLNDEFGASSVSIGFYLSLMSISTALLSYKAGAIMGRLGRKKPVALAFFFYALSFAIMGGTHHEAYLVLAVMFFGIGQGLNLPSLQVMVLNSVPSSLKASVSALYASTLRIGQSIGPVFLGACFALGSYQAVFLVSVLLAALVGACIVMAIARSAQ